MLPRLAVLISVVFSGACGAGVEDTTLDIVFDPCELVVLAPDDTWTDEQRASIDDAIAMWAEVDGPVLTLDPVAGAPVIPIGFEKAAPAFYGLYRDELGDVVVNTTLTNRHARAVTIAHELGHAFGLLHNKDRASVMKSGNLEIEPGSTDVAALRAIWGSCSNGAPASVATH